MFSLRQTWTALILFAVIAPVATVTIWFGKGHYEDQFELALLVEHQASELLGNRIETEIRRFDTLLTNKSDPFAYFLDAIDDAVNLKEINVLLGLIVKREPAIHCVMIVSREAGVIATIDPAIGLLGDHELSADEQQAAAIHWGYVGNYEQPEIVIPSMGRHYIGSPYPHEDSFGFTIAVPVGESTKAVLLAKIDFDTLWQANFSRELDTQTRGARHYLLDHRGALLNEIDGSDHARGDLMTHLEIARAALTGEEWPSEQSYIGVADQRVYGTKTHLPSLNWTLVSEIPVSDITGPILDQLAAMAMVGLLVVFVFVTAALFLARKTLGPLQQVSTAIRRVAKGDYRVDLGSSRIREFNSLTSSFTEMARRREQAETEAARFGRLVEASSNEIYIFDDETLLFSNVNFGARKNLGYTMDELSRLAPWDITPEFTPEAFKRLIEPLRRGAQHGIEITTVHRRKNGTLYPVEIHIQRVTEGAPAFVAFVIDITERRKADAEKEEYQARSAAVLKNSVDAIVTIDDRGIIESVNPAAETLFGYEQAELIGQNVAILMPKPYSANHDGYIEAYNSGGPKHAIDRAREVDGLRKDGTTFPLRLSVSEITFGDRRIFAGMIHDLTHETELEQQLLQAQKLESLGTLAGGIAHDFNNILQAILGFSSIALENVNENDETLKQCLEEIDAGGRRATELVDQILTFSRNTGVEIGPLNLQPLVKEALRFIKNSIPATIRIDSNIDPDCARVAADATQIHQVVTNLCTNAMHAMEEDGTGTLSVSLKPFALDSPLETLSGQIQPGDYVELRVVDTGAGIDRASLQQVLDPFYTTKEAGKGTGLGLAIVHGIAKGMDGGLSIESELGKGTTVRALFPVFQESKGPEQPQEAPTIASNGNAHVMIVDDEEAITRLTTFLLESRGFTVEAFNDVAAALEAAADDSKTYDVALLDYTMPGKTGLELAKELAAIVPEMSVILATGLVDRSTIEQSKSSNVLEVIKKPFDVDTLVAAINRAR